VTGLLDEWIFEICTINEIQKNEARKTRKCKK